MSQALGYELTSYYYRLKYIQELESGSNPVLKKRHDIKSAKAFIKKTPEYKMPMSFLIKDGKLIQISGLQYSDTKYFYMQY